MVMTFSKFGGTEGNKPQGYVIICRQQIARPDKNCTKWVFKIIFQDLLHWTEILLWLLVACWEFPELGEEITLQNRDTCKLENFVMQHQGLCYVVNCSQTTTTKVKWFTEISRYPTNLFSGIVTWNTIF